MCGIVGFQLYNNQINSALQEENLKKGCDALNRRGPDYSQQILQGNIGLGHARLSILDTSNNGNQPMLDKSGRFGLIFNGEIYNFQAIRKELEVLGHSFYSSSDTEVVLYALIAFGKNAIQKFNGFFSFAFIDYENNYTLLARDRIGIKPLHYFLHEEGLVYASELKAIFPFFTQRPEINREALVHYLHLNYIPGELTIYDEVHKLPPGGVLEFDGKKVEQSVFYDLDKPHVSEEKMFLSLEEEVYHLLYDSVKKRMLSDVPLGAFLSGGIDSSIIVALASQQTDKLSTFSIGFKDDPYFDETAYAKLVSKHFNTKHTEFKLGFDEVYDVLFPVLDYMDEPFADSSSLPVFLLSQKTREEVTVALSGDGGDELFGGYNKHKAEFLVKNGGWKAGMVEKLAPLWDVLPKSRNSKWTNKVRQFARFAEFRGLDAKSRYWRWCGFYQNNQEVLKLLNPSFFGESLEVEMHKSIEKFTRFIDDESDLDATLRADISLVLPGDMLTKVDRMSMVNSLEVRVPFLDHRIVEFSRKVPVSKKNDGKLGKILLRNAFKDTLPAEIWSHPKHGFEIPLLHWLRNELSGLIWDELLESKFIEEQGIFDIEMILKLKQKLYSKNPEDAHAKVYGLLVFQYWYKNTYLKL